MPFPYADVVCHQSGGPAIHHPATPHTHYDPSDETGSSGGHQIHAFRLFRFVATQLGKAAILACGKFVKADRAIFIGVEFLGVHY